MTWWHSTMVAAVGNNLPRSVAGDNDAVEWFLMFTILSIMVGEAASYATCIFKIKHHINSLLY
jgi:hypothetical protein